MTNLVIPTEESFHFKKYNVNKHGGIFKGSEWKFTVNIQNILECIPQVVKGFSCLWLCNSKTRYVDLLELMRHYWEKEKEAN